MNIKNGFLCLFCGIFLFSCKQKPKENNSQRITSSEINQLVKPNYLIGCEQIAGITKSDRRDNIQQKFSVNRITTDSLYLEGNFEGLFTTIDKGLKTELIIYWKTTGTVNYVEIKHPQSPYYFANGIKIGKSLKELVALNGREINFYGFGWDYGGKSISFNNGNITKSDPCFSCVFTLGEGQNLKNQNQMALINGDHAISSNNKILDEFEVYLSVIRIQMD